MDIPFGRYRLVERLALGGMGELFLARTTGEGGFEKTCVIKRLLPHLAADPELITMFLDEARLTARLSHPNIAQLYELGREGDDYYLVMEYLAGEDAASIIRESRRAGQPVPLDVAARIAIGAAEALHYAHELNDPDGRCLNIVHRDVSPSNLFLTYQGAVKVIDFGIARTEARLTRTEAGSVKGKAAYMAPEQARGLPVDRRVDVWALGVCLHELLTGQRLFQADSHLAVAQQIIEGPLPPPSSIRPEVPEALDAIVCRALQRKPDERFQTLEPMRVALEDFLAERTYAPDARRLALFLRNLFGNERAEEKIGRGAASGREALVARERTENLRGREAEVERRLPLRSAERSEARRGGRGEGRTALTLATDATATDTARQWRPGLGRRTLLAGGALLVVGLLAGILAGRAAERRGAARSSEGPVAAISEAARPRAGNGSAEEAPVSTAPAGAVAAVPASSAAGAPRAESSAAETAADTPAPTRSDNGDARAESSAAGTAAATPASSRSDNGDAHAESSAAETAVATPAPMRPDKHDARAWGRLTVQANLPVSVFVDGRLLGTTPLSRLKVAAGRRQLKLESASRGLSRTATVVVEEGRELVHRAQFRQTSLNVDSTPWSEVWLDGKLIGVTPIAGHQVWEGPHRVRLVSPAGEKTLELRAVAGTVAVVKERLP